MLHRAELQQMIEQWSEGLRSIEESGTPFDKVMQTQVEANDVCWNCIGSIFMVSISQLPSELSEEDKLKSVMGFALSLGLYVGRSSTFMSEN